MKTALFILSMSFIWSTAKAEDVIVNRVYFGGDDHMDFLVPREELCKVRSWEPGAGHDAPLTRNQALEIARNAALAEGLDISDNTKLVISLTKTNPFEENLIRCLPPGCCRWFYLVNFMGEDAALRGKFTFLVCMSGAIASKAAGPSQ